MKRTFVLAFALLGAATLFTAGCGGPTPPPLVQNAEPLPADLARAVDKFTPEGNRGWSFMQTTTSGDHTIVERYDANQLEFKRWTLVSKDGKLPDEDALKEYKESIENRTVGGTPPNVRDQIIRETWERVPTDDPGLSAVRFRLKPGNEEDKSANFMAVTFFIHKASDTVVRVELGSLSSFTPMFGVQIYEAKTVIRYHTPTSERPVLLDDIHVSIKGRAMGFKSLDKDMRVVYADYQPAKSAAKTP